MEIERVPSEIRKGLRRAMIDGGIPAAHVDEAIDLGCHATEQAIHQVESIINRAGTYSCRLAAYSIAASLVSETLQNKMQLLQQETRQRGGLILEASIGGQAHG